MTANFIRLPLSTAKKKSLMLFICFIRMWLIYLAVDEFRGSDLLRKKTKRKNLNDPVGGTGSKHIRELLDGQRESFSEKTRGLFDGHGKSFRNLGGRMAFHKQDNESTFVNAGAGWLNDGENGQFYSLTFEREVIDKYWDHLVVNGCLLIKNQFKGDDGRKPDVILRLRVPSDDVKGQTDDESLALN